ncbi:hypothetical protein [Romboutsia sp.]|uniref:hypothetical protein n=1 Tax=Romboutsia sp. TaxID=1965302 RepID=UPI003F66C712
MNCDAIRFISICNVTEKSFCASINSRVVFCGVIILVTMDFVTVESVICRQSVSRNLVFLMIVVAYFKFRLTYAL